MDAQDTQSQSQLSFNSSTQTSQIIPIEPVESEEEIDKLIKEIEEGLKDNTLTITLISASSFERTLTIHLPARLLNIAFICDSLSAEDSSTLIAKQLITPLFGMNSVLLNLFSTSTLSTSTSTSTSNQALNLSMNIMKEIDNLGKIERAKPGKAIENLFKFGGNQCLTRFSQKESGRKESKLLPVSLSLPPSISNPTTLAPTQPLQIKPELSPSPKKPIINPSPPSFSSTSTLPKSKSNFAQQIFRPSLHQSGNSTGEKISWDETQEFEDEGRNEMKKRSEPRKSYSFVQVEEEIEINRKGKGKEIEKEMVLNNLPIEIETEEQKEGEEEEEEPSTQDEEESIQMDLEEEEEDEEEELEMPPPQQISSSPSKNYYNNSNDNNPSPTPSPSPSLSSNQQNQFQNFNNTSQQFIPSSPSPSPSPSPIKPIPTPTNSFEPATSVENPTIVGVGGGKLNKFEEQMRKEARERAELVELQLELEKTKVIICGNKKGGEKKKRKKGL